jgi:hypothetical protein
MRRGGRSDEKLDLYGLEEKAACQEVQVAVKARRSEKETNRDAME